MDLDQYTKMISPAPLPADELEEMILAEHARDPQRTARVRNALESVRHGLSELAACGHRFHIAPGGDAPHLEFPRMLYKNEGQVLREQIVHSTEELDLARQGGWRDTPAK